MGDGDALMGGLGTLIVAGAVLGAMNNRNRERTRTVTKTKYVTKYVTKTPKSKYLKLKPKKVVKKRKQPTSFFG